MNYYPNILWEDMEQVINDLYFMEDGHCFDVWFDCSSVSEVIIHNVKESFKLEEIT